MNQTYASRWIRFCARVVDNIFESVLIVVLACAGQLTLTSIVSTIACVVAATMPLVAQSVLLAKRGQSVGKLLVGICIVDEVGRGVPKFSKVVVLRTWTVWLASLLAGLMLVWPPLVLLVDALPIFGSRRKCLHDILAGTVVVRCDRSTTPTHDCLVSAQ